MNAGVRNALLIAVIVVAASLAVWQVTRPAKESVHPDTAESSTDWICDNPQCGHALQLTSKQRDEWAESTDKVRRGEQYDPRLTVFKCPKCGQFTMVRAMKCPQHHCLFPKRHPDGSPGDCAQCVRERGGG
jgi:predicted RNA-binding Zn-ribbon protein involved in translation (DUF1610 family)